MERVLTSCAGLLFVVVASLVYAIDVTPATGPSDALTFAGDLVASGSPITVNSASFLIDLVGGGTAASEIRAIGSFTNGNVGGPFPTINQLGPQNPAAYAGGIGLDAGVCLCTGLVTDADVEGANAVEGSGVGIEGPNNGFPITAFLADPPPPGQTPLNAGEVSFRTNTPRDADFAAVKTVDPVEEGDATVLQFEITLASPGFLRISFVFASDEHPFYIAEFEGDVNDSMAIFVRHDTALCPDAEFENIALLKAPGEPDQPMSLREL